jgi:hypothetical protein
MAKLKIGDKTVTVDDSFLSMSPDEQNAAVEEIAGSLGASSPQPQQTQNSVGGFIGNAVSDLADVSAGFIRSIGKAGEITAGGVLNGANMVLPESMQLGQNPVGQKSMEAAAAFPSQVGSAVSGAGHMANGIIVDAARNTPYLKDHMYQLPQDVADADAFKNMMEPIGTLPKLGQAILKKPFTSAINLSGALSGGAGLVARVPMLGGEAGMLASALRKGAEFTNPVNAITKPIGQFTPLGNAPIEGQTRGSAALLKSLMPKDAAARAAAIGPEAMLLDTSPSMVGLARGVSAKVGPATDNLVEKLIDRQKSNAKEFLPKADKIMGSQYDTTLLSKSIDRGTRKAAAPYYGSAIKNAQPLSSDLANKLARRLTSPAKDMGLENRASMGDIMTKIDDALLGENPKQVAKRLWDNRKTLDAKIVYDNNSMSNLSSADKAAQGILKQGRKTIDGVLKDNYPGFSRGDQIMAAGKKAQDDIEFGRTSLRNGETPQTFDVFKKEYGKRDKRFVDIGIKADIRNSLTGAPNDFLALRKKLGGDGDNNRLKLDHSLGPKITDKLNSFVEGRGTMSQNFADIVRNAKTAQSLEAAKLIPDGPRFKATGSETVHGTLVARPFAATLNYLAEKTAGKVNAATSEALSNSLTKKGNDLTKLLSDLSANKKVPLKDKTLIRALLISQTAQFSKATQQAPQ